MKNGYFYVISDFPCTTVAGSLEEENEHLKVNKMLVARVPATSCMKGVLISPGTIIPAHLIYLCLQHVYV